MTPDRDRSIQFRVPAGEVSQLEEDLELTGLKATEFFANFAWECAHFIIKSAQTGAEVISIRPDGTQMEFIPRIVDRIRRISSESKQ